MSIFEEFDEILNDEIINEANTRTSGNNSDFDDVPAGEYIVSIERMEVAPTNDGKKLKFAVGMKITENLDDGGQVGRWIFFNRVICGNKPNAKGTWNDGVAIKGVISWLDKFSPTLLVFDTYSNFATDVKAVFEAVKDTVELEVEYNPKEFNPIKIKNVFDKQ